MVGQSLRVLPLPLFVSQSLLIHCNKSKDLDYIIQTVQNTSKGVINHRQLSRHWTGEFVFAAKKGVKIYLAFL